MNFTDEEQKEYTAQKEYAQNLIKWKVFPTLDLWYVKYPEGEGRVTIVGGTIVKSSIEIWKDMGAEATHLETISADKL